MFIQVLGIRFCEIKTSFISGQASVDEVSGMSQLERVCAEIVQTENVYVEDLRQVVEVSLNTNK